MIDWPFELRPLTANLGAQIVNVDLAKGVDDALFAAIYQAFVIHMVSSRKAAGCRLWATG